MRLFPVKSLRPIRLVYALLTLSALIFAWFAYHSITAFEAKVYSLREGYLNEITHALSGPLARLEQQGIKDPRDLTAIFEPLKRLDNPALYDVESDHQILLQILLTDQQGKVLFDSSGKIQGLDLSDRSEVKAALLGEIQRRDEDEGHGIYRMSVGVPIRSEGKIIGALIAQEQCSLKTPCCRS